MIYTGEDIVKPFSTWGRIPSLIDIIKRNEKNSALFEGREASSCTDIWLHGFKYGKSRAIDLLGKEFDKERPMDKEGTFFEPLIPYSSTERRRIRPGNDDFKVLKVDCLTDKSHMVTEHFARFTKTHHQEVNMDRVVNQSSKSFIPVDIGKSYLNEAIAYFKDIFGHLPKEYYAQDYDELNSILNLEKTMKAVEENFTVKNSFLFRRKDQKSKKIVIHEANYVLENGTLLFLTNLFNAVIVIYDDKKNLDALLPHIFAKKVRKQKEKPKFSMLVHGSNGFRTMEFELKPFSIDVKSNYNDDLPDEKIRHFIEADGEAGICILHGKPGTGKTYYIRDLIKKSKRDFIYISKECLNYISNASFVGFLTYHKNCVFIMEDCENVLVDRTQYNNTISTLLNLSDGLLGDSLNNKFLCTFNTDICNIDDALLRKGRMKVCYEFKYLNADKANKLAEKLNKSERFDNDVPLCDVFNSESNGTEEIPAKKHKKIGF